MTTLAETPLPTAERMDDDDKPWWCRCGTDVHPSFDSVALVPDIFELVDVDYHCTMTGGGDLL